MSPIRRNLTRSDRTLVPYGRPAPKWSWGFSDFLSYLEPLRRLIFDFDFEGDAVEESSTSSQREQQKQQARATLENERALLNSTLGTKPVQVQGPSSASGGATIPKAEFTFRATSSRSQNLDAVASFLKSHANRPIGTEDTKRIVALLKRSKPETFHFKSCPRNGSFARPAPVAPSAPRTLEENPNGEYVWRGTGGSKVNPAPNFKRHSWKPFPVAPSSSGPEISGNDAEECGVGDSILELEPQALSVQSQVLSPATSFAPLQETATGDHSLRPPATTPLRQGTPGLHSSVPVLPSPLRQAWTGNSPSSSESGSPQTFKQTNQQTNVTNHQQTEMAKQTEMVGQIKTAKGTEAAKHISKLISSMSSRDGILDAVRNPYEIPHLQLPKKRKRVVQPKADPKEDNTQVKEMSAYAIIEATLPEGSTRSRPIIITDEEEEDLPVTKRSRTQSDGQTTVELADVEMQSVAPQENPTQENPQPSKVPMTPTTSRLPAPRQTLFDPKSSMPKEPSKLRFSMQLEPTSIPSSPVPQMSFASPVSVPTFKVTPPTPVQVTPTSTSGSASVNSKNIATSQPPTDFAFASPSSPTTSNAKAHGEAKVTSRVSLPAFDIQSSAFSS